MAFYQKCQVKRVLVTKRVELTFSICNTKYSHNKQWSNKMANLNWEPTINLNRYFVPTRLDKSAEMAKARYKNYNLPILQYMYNGNNLTPLRCTMTDRLGWVDFACLVTEKAKQRFDIDFNHIRQEQKGRCIAGNSKDKGACDPSAIFRSKHLDKNPLLLLEFMTIMPVSQEYHKYITQDSALAHLTLLNFNKKYWPWVLQSAKNFNEFCKHYNIKGITHIWFINHLSDITNPAIQDRIEFKTITNKDNTISHKAVLKDLTSDVIPV